MSKNQRIIAAILVFAAIGYLLAYTIVTHPYFVERSSDDQPRNHSEVRPTSTEPSGSRATTAPAQAEFAAQTTDPIPEPIEHSELTDSNHVEVQSTIAVLSDPQRLHGAMAQSLMAERDFDDVIRGLEKTLPEAFEREARLLDAINRMDPVLDNRLRLRVLNCNDVFCGIAFNNDSEDAVLEFVGALMATGVESGAMSIQPIVIDDIPQLRIILHRSASYQVD